MRPERSLILPLVLCLAAGCSRSGSSSSEAPPAPARPPDGEEHLSKVIAEVNGRPIYAAFYEQTLNFMRNRLSAGHDEANVERYLNAKFDALERLVDDELIYQQAQREGLTIPEEQVRAEYERMASASGGEARFLAGMKAQLLSKWDTLEGIRRRLTIDRYVRERVTAGVHVADEEMLQYYNSRLSRFTPELYVKLHQITIRCPRDAGADRVEKARQRALKILGNIRAGEPFERMAREYSEDSTAALGGSLGFVRRGATYPEFDAIAFTMSPGEVSDVIRTDEGFHIIKVAERRGGAPRPYEDVKEECRKSVLTKKQAEAIGGLTSYLRQSARIVSHLE